MEKGSQWVGPITNPDKYRLIGLLGQGSEGHVWKAEYLVAPGKPALAAIKAMRKVASKEDLETWNSRSELFWNLATIPGIVKVKEFFLGHQAYSSNQLAATIVGAHHDINGEPQILNTRDEVPLFPYVVMEFVEGEPLTDWLAASAEKSVANKLRCLRPIAAALDILHRGQTHFQHPAVHGDVKPQNIIVRPDGSAVLVDLGLTQLFDDSAPAGRSQPYAAPELYEAEARATFDSDRFAFAATAIHIILNHPPPIGIAGPDIETIGHQLRASPLSARKPRMAEFLLAALSADPTTRPRELSSWLETLVTMLSDTKWTLTAGTISSTTKASSPVRTTTPRWRRSSIAAITSASILSSLLLAFVLMRPWNNPEHGASGTPSPSTSSTGTMSPTPSPTTSASPDATPIPSSSPLPSTKAPLPPAYTMPCPSPCETSLREKSFGGASGQLASDHMLAMFTRDEGSGLYYLGSYVFPSQGQWSGTVKLGNDSGTSPSYTYEVCLYDIDQAFHDDLTAKGKALVNQGLEKIPTVGTAIAVACQKVRWLRPPVATPTP